MVRLQQATTGGRVSNTSGAESGRYRLWAILYLGFVIYGSLIPFRFRPLPLAEAFRQFRQIPYLQLGVELRADWVANILLYVPLAILAAAALSTRWRRSTAAALAFVGCSLVAVAVEFLQMYFPRRTVSLNDIIAEVLGSGLGALCWLLLGQRLDEIRRALRHPGARAPQLLAMLYWGLYLGFAFFPLDLLVSTQELHWKLAGGSAGWWQAPKGCARAISCLGTRTAEIMAAVPLGLGLGFWLPRLSLRAGFAWAAAVGFGLGLGIEALQFFTASNISQGVSALCRGSGIVLGYGIYRLARRDWPARGAEALRRRTIVAILALVYLTASLGLTVAGKGPWLTEADLAWRLKSLHFLPFYYHYYTSESRALESLLLNLGLYAPVGLLARGVRAAPTGKATALAAMGLAGLWAVALETAKLALRQGRPDPTNILIAALGALLGYWLARRLLPSAT